MTARARIASRLPWVTALVLAAVAVVPWLIPPENLGPARPQEGPAAATVAVVPALERRPLEQFSAFAERPPFTATRRPAPDGEKEQENLILGRYRLAGVVVAPMTRSVILTSLGNQSVVVAEGEEVDGWTVDEVSLDRIVFVSDGRRREVLVEDATGARRP